MLKNSVYNLKVALIYHIHSAHDEKPFGVHHLPTSPPKRQGTTKNVLFPTCQVIVSRFYQSACLFIDLVRLGLRLCVNSQDLTRHCGPQP